MSSSTRVCSQLYRRCTHCLPTALWISWWRRKTIRRRLSRRSASSSTQSLPLGPSPIAVMSPAVCSRTRVRSSQVSGETSAPVSTRRRSSQRIAFHSSSTISTSSSRTTCLRGAAAQGKSAFCARFSWPCLTPTFISYRSGSAAVN